MSKAHKAIEAEFRAAEALEEFKAALFPELVEGLEKTIALYIDIVHTFSEPMERELADISNLIAKAKAGPQ